jgi:hypothetical protein
MITKRDEIDLREKISAEIKAEMAHLKLDENTAWAFNRAIGIVRASIWHQFNCPCSLCQQFETVSCVDSCNSLRVTTYKEYEQLVAAFLHESDTVFECRVCNNGQNYWLLIQMLYDSKREICVTPCCHSEATEALKCHCAAKGEACPEYAANHA